jgi:hypothetical protein
MIARPELIDPDPELEYLRQTAKFQGKVESIDFVAGVLRLTVEYAAQTAEEIAAREEAIDRCIRKGVHWNTTTESTAKRKGGPVPRCNRCGARADLPHTEDPGLRYKAFQQVLRLCEPTKPHISVLPTDDDLRNAGWLDYENAFPTDLPKSARKTWGVLFACYKHDGRALRLAMKLARASGVLL